MKRFSINRRSVSRARAKNAALLNLLATPGLGSLFCRRWIAGTCQLILALVGCAMILIWFVREMYALYSTTVFSETPSASPGWRPLEIGAILLAASWIWAAFTSISLFGGATDEKLQSLKNSAAPPPLKWEATRIAIALTSIPNWKQNGDSISRTFQFRDFPAAIKFVNAVAETAEREWHHPDIDIRWNQVALALTTHDSGGLTEKDFALAKKFDGLSLR